MATREQSEMSCYCAFSFTLALDNYGDFNVSSRGPWLKFLMQDIFFSTMMHLFQVLCLHLKRFKFVSFHRSKIDTTVEFPLENLDMSDYVLPAVVSLGSFSFDIAFIIL